MFPSSAPHHQVAPRRAVRRTIRYLAERSCMMQSHRTTRRRRPRTPDPPKAGSPRVRKSCTGFRLDPACPACGGKLRSRWPGSKTSFGGSGSGSNHWSVYMCRVRLRDQRQGCARGGLWSLDEAHRVLEHALVSVVLRGRLQASIVHHVWRRLEERGTWSGVEIRTRVAWERDATRRFKSRSVSVLG